MSRKRDSMIENNETYPKSYSHASRGFFAVLIVCLIAVGGVAAATFSQSLDQPPLADDSGTTGTTAATTATTIAEPVAVTPATTSTTAATTTEKTTTTTTTAKEEALYVLPLSNKVLTGYSDTPVYFPILDAYRTHNALDFDGEEGQSVRPFADGTVASVQDDALWSGCVTIDHGEGVVSVYRGLEPTVSEGDAVTTDMVIGKLGAVPCESNLGPHLHFELQQNGTFTDPSRIFGKQLVYETE